MILVRVLMFAVIDSREVGMLVCDKWRDPMRIAITITSLLNKL